jgi:hypothetical protein
MAYQKSLKSDGPVAEGSPPPFAASGKKGKPFGKKAKRAPAQKALTAPRAFGGGR